MINDGILNQALDNYSNPNGQVNWKRAFAENPTWKRTLLAGGKNMQGAVYTPINAIKERRKKQGHVTVVPTPPTPTETLALAIAEPAMPVALDDPRAIVELCVEQYRVGKRTDWIQANREHPEWRELIGSPNKRNYYVGKIREDQKLERKSARAAEKNGEPRDLPAAPPLRYCPHCGGALEAIQIAMSAVAGVL